MRALLVWYGEAKDISMTGVGRGRDGHWFGEV